MIVFFVNFYLLSKNCIFNFLSFSAKKIYILILIQNKPKTKKPLKINNIIKFQAI